MPELRDRVALITGASSGIGAAIALRLAQEGVHLALSARNSARLAQTAERTRALGVRAETYLADLSSMDDIHSLKLEIDEAFGGIDILVHAAGVFRPGTMAECTPAHFEESWRLNVHAPYALTHKLLPALRRRRGDIVFINSRAALRATAGLSAYCASKVALKMVADALRKEVALEGVRVMSIYPGKVATPMQEQVQAWLGNAYAPEAYPQPEEIAEIIVQALRLPAGTEVPDLTIMPHQDAAIG